MTLSRRPGRAVSRSAPVTPSWPTEPAATGTGDGPLSGTGLGHGGCPPSDVSGGAGEFRSASPISVGTGQKLGDGEGTGGGGAGAAATVPPGREGAGGRGAGGGRAGPPGPLTK